MKSLKRVLQRLEALEVDEDNAHHVNAIRGTALAIQIPLRNFLQELEKYEVSLGPFSDPRWYRGVSQKSKWAIAFGEKTEKFRLQITGKTASIGLLLNLYLW